MVSTRRLLNFAMILWVLRSMRKMRVTGWGLFFCYQCGQGKTVEQSSPFLLFFFFGLETCMHKTLYFFESAHFNCSPVTFMNNIYPLSAFWRLLVHCSHFLLMDYLFLCGSRTPRDCVIFHGMPKLGHVSTLCCTDSSSWWCVEFSQLKLPVLILT